MRRLYYLADTLAAVDAACETIRDDSPGDFKIHVLSRDEAGLYRHQLHSARSWQKRDFVRSGERGALIGLGLGVVTAAIGAGIGTYQGRELYEMFGVVLVIFTLFGAWTGGLFGIQTENYKVQPFHDDIEAGRYLVMVDVRRQHSERIRRIMDYVQPLEYAGSDNSLMLPFGRAQPGIA